jgi:large subunit ribosomal protein L13
MDAPPHVASAKLHLGTMLLSRALAASSKAPHTRGMATHNFKSVVKTNNLLSQKRAKKLAQRVIDAAPRDGSKAWHIIDAENMVVGRLATRIASLLQGKHKPTYRPDVDTGDYVVVTNAEKVVFTGEKFRKKKYMYHTGWVGHLRERTPQQLHEKGMPEEILRRAVSGMLPKNKLRRTFERKLNIYPGSEHYFGEVIPADQQPLFPREKVISASLEEELTEEQKKELAAEEELVRKLVEEEGAIVYDV